MSILLSTLSHFRLRRSSLYSGLPPSLPPCLSVSPAVCLSSCLSVCLSDSIVSRLGVTNGLPQSGQQLCESLWRHDYKLCLFQRLLIVLKLQQQHTELRWRPRQMLKIEDERLINSHWDEFKVRSASCGLVMRLHLWGSKFSLGCTWNLLFWFWC